jgi:hypothetical protein
MTWSEIGRRLNISPQAAQAACARGLKKIASRPRTLFEFQKLALLLDEARRQNRKAETDASRN